MRNRNEKTMNVLSLKETRDAFAKLYMKYIHNGVIHDTTKVVFWYVCLLLQRRFESLSRSDESSFLIGAASSLHWACRIGAS